jgi:hypothetical protein
VIYYFLALVTSDLLVPDLGLNSETVYASTNNTITKSVVPQVDLHAHPPQWKLISNTDGISTYEGKVDGVPLIFFRGVMDLQEPAASIASFAFYNQYRKKWIDRIDQNRIVEQRSPMNWLEFSSFHMPWPMRPREFLMDVSLDFIQGEKLITVSAHSVESDLVPVDVKRAVRGKIYASYFAVQKTENGTHLEVVAATDAGGSIPYWFTNFIQRSWARNTLMKMIEVYRSEREPIKIEPRFGEFYSKH